MTFNPAILRLLTDNIIQGCKMGAKKHVMDYLKI